jgi:hypothetical protein
MSGYSVNFIIIIIIIIIIITYMTALLQNRENRTAEVTTTCTCATTRPFSVATYANLTTQLVAHQDTNGLPQGRPALRTVSQC